MVLDHLSVLVPLVTANYNLCNNMDTPIPSNKYATLRRSFITTGIKLWNNLPLDIRESPSLESFKIKTAQRIEICNCELLLWAIMASCFAC